MSNKKDLHKINLLSSVVKQVDDAVFITDKEGVIQYVNPSFERMTGFSKKESLGQTPRIIKSGYHPPEFYEKLWTTILRGESFRDTVVNKTKSGKLFYADHTVTPLKDPSGEILGFVCTWKDITQQKQLEKRKDEFVGVVSHELKTPLTTIKVFTQVLKKRIGEVGDEKSQLYISKIDTHLDKLTNLIDEFLQITRIDSGKLELKRELLDIDKLIEEVVEDMQILAEQHHLVVKGKARKQIKGDKERIGQVLVNLISNAIKYSPEANEVIISVGVNKKEIEISVRDFGAGIPLEHQGKLFERFYQVSPQSGPGLSGLGLGLYICAEIVRRHNGKIWVKSKSSQGSTFFFTLPLR